MAAICRKAWREHGRTPAELFAALTPTQFVALFFKAAEQSLDPLAELVRHNRERGRRGLLPAIPSWLS